MANKTKIVLYKLQPFGKGFVVPANIKKCGEIWEDAENPGDVIFVGEVDEDKLEDTTYIKVVTKTAKTQHFKDAAATRVKQFKKKMFKKYVEPFFAEAYTRKEMGDTKMWNKYIKRMEKVDAITKLPKEKNKGLAFNDDLDD